MAPKKVLIITYYWPPAGGPGVQRWLNFVKYLPQYGIEPIVYCPENPNYPIKDESLEEEVARDVKVIKHPIKEPYKMASLFSRKNAQSISSGIIPAIGEQSLVQKLMLFIRGNFFIPDARKYWVKPSVEYLETYINKYPVDTIITTGPPHSLHLIGMALKKRLAVKWITDFRDPWTTIGYHKSLKLTATSTKKHLRLERLVLNSADRIIVTSEHTKKEFMLKTDRPISVITNGYDTHDVRVDQKDNLFTISHVGSLLSDRDPKILWTVLNELRNENELFSKMFKLQLIGVVSQDVLDSIKAHQLNEYLDLKGYVSHKEAIEFQLKSQVLLLIEIDSHNTKAIIPGKLFEYMHSNTPILAIGPEESDIYKIISKTKTGFYFTYNQREELKQCILKMFNDFKGGALKMAPVGLESYSRKELTNQLAKLI